LALRQEDRIVVPATAADVAHAIGSVREVVARVLQSFKQDGLLAGTGQNFVLCDLAGLHTAAMEAVDKSHARRH
jgi:CRP-like cAMP-binding protein